MRRDLYPANWSEIAHEIKDACGWQCQECGRQCRRPGEPFDTHRRTLTVAQRLGITITWQHIDLAPGSQWEEGRGT